MSTSITPDDYLNILECIKPKDITYCECSNEFIEPTPERCMACDAEFSDWCTSCEDIMICATCGACPTCQSPEIDVKQKMKAILQPANIEISSVDFKDGYSRDYYRMGEQYLVSGIIKSCGETGLATNCPVHFIHVEESMPGYPLHSGGAFSLKRKSRLESNRNSPFLAIVHI